VDSGSRGRDGVGQGIKDGGGEHDRGAAGDSRGGGRVRGGQEGSGRVRGGQEGSGRVRGGQEGSGRVRGGRRATTGMINFGRDGNTGDGRATADSRADDISRANSFFLTQEIQPVTHITL
jgi:hypothetical protein